MALDIMAGKVLNHETYTNLRQVYGNTSVYDILLYVQYYYIEMHHNKMKRILGKARIINSSTAIIECDLCTAYSFLMPAFNI